MFIRLKPRSERRLSADEIIQELRRKVSQVVGIQMFMQNLPPIRIGGRLTKSEYQFTLQSPDTAELYKYSEIFLSKLKELPLLQDVTTDLQIKNPQVNVEIDRDKASSLDVTAEQIESGLGAAYGSLQISTIYSPTNQYQVITEVAPKYQRDPSALPLLYIRSSPGTLVPLNAVTRVSQDVGPLSVNHQGQLPSVTISFNLKPGISLGDALEAITRLARTTLPARPSRKK